MGRLNYRWEIARSHLIDITDGLERDDAEVA